MAALEHYTGMLNQAQARKRAILNLIDLAHDTEDLEVVLNSLLTLGITKEEFTAYMR